MSLLMQALWQTYDIYGGVSGTLDRPCEHLTLISAALLEYMMVPICSGRCLDPLPMQARWRRTTSAAA